MQNYKNLFVFRMWYLPLASNFLAKRFCFKNILKNKNRSFRRFGWGRRIFGHLECGEAFCANHETGGPRAGHQHPRGRREWATHYDKVTKSQKYYRIFINNFKIFFKY